MDIDGVDAEVLYFGGPLAVQGSGLRLNSVRGYNRWLSEFASHAPDRLLGVAAIPIDTPERGGRGDPWARQQPGLASGVHPAVPHEGDYGEDRSGTRCGRRSSRADCPSACTADGRRPGHAGA